MTSIRTDAISAHQHAVERSKSFNTAQRKYRTANTLAVMMIGVCGIAAGVLAFQQAEDHYRREAIINQEVLAWRK